MRSLLKVCSYILLHSIVSYIQQFNPLQLLTVVIKDCSIAQSIKSLDQNRSDILIV